MFNIFLFHCENVVGIYVSNKRKVESNFLLTILLNKGKL